MSDNERRRRLDSVIPELLKRAVEIGVEKAVEAPDSFKELVGGMRLPREVAHYLLSQVEETKNGLLRVVAKEVRDFLDQTNLSNEMQKMLTTVQFEINTTIRFTPNEGREDERAISEAEMDGAGAQKLPKPEIKSEVHVRRDDRPRERRRTRE
ncbi:MAG: hypothetical protein M3O50_01520 [Myxococcota bacterium]|nr:hypothetical protein [Myxococcota bacterium]